MAIAVLPSPANAPRGKPRGTESLTTVMEKHVKARGGQVYFIFWPSPLGFTCSLPESELEALNAERARLRREAASAAARAAAPLHLLLCRSGGGVEQPHAVWRPRGR